MLSCQLKKKKNQIDELQQALAQRGGGSPQHHMSLREERRRLEDQVSTLNAKLREVETHNGQLFHENSSLKSHSKNLEAQSTSTARMKAKLTDDLANANEDLQKREYHITTLTKELENLRQENEELCSRFKAEPDQSHYSLQEEALNDLRLDIENKKQSISQLQEELSASKNERDKEKAEYENQLSSATDEMKKKLSMALADLEDKRVKQRSMEVQIDDHKRENFSLSTELHSLKEEVIKLDTNIQAERERVETFTDKVRELQESLKEEQMKQIASTNCQAFQETEIQTLTDQLETLRSQYDSLSKDNDEFQDLVSTLTKTNSGLKREVDELKFKLKKQSEDGSQMSSSESTNTSKNPGVNDVLSQLEEVQRERDELMEEFEEVREEVVSLRREKMALTQQVNDLRQSIEPLNAQIAMMSTKIAPQETDASGKLSSNEDHREELKKKKEEDEILFKLKEELSDTVTANQHLKNELNGLTWKLEELSELEQELQDAQRDLASVQLEKRILSHDLEEAHTELSAVQTDKHLLMKEVERLSELEAGKLTSNAEPSPSCESISDMEDGFSSHNPSGPSDLSNDLKEMQRLVDEKTKAMSALKAEMEWKEENLQSHIDNIVELEKNISEKNEKLSEIEGLKQSCNALTEENEVLKIEVQTLQKKVDGFNLKIDTVKSLEADFDSLNNDFTKVLEEKSQMACQIEELHSRIQELMSREHEVKFSTEHQEHVLREKETLQRRVDELEGVEGNSMQEHARLKQELDQVCVFNLSLFVFDKVIHFSSICNKIYKTDFFK